MPEDHIRYDILAQEALRGVMRKVLGEVARTGLPGNHHFFITFLTGASGVRVSSRLRERYPEQMTIVIQYQYWDLKVTDVGFEIGLSFSDIPEKEVEEAALVQVLRRRQTPVLVGAFTHFLKRLGKMYIRLGFYLTGKIRDSLNKPLRAGVNGVAARDIFYPHRAVPFIIPPHLFEDCLGIAFNVHVGAHQHQAHTAYPGCLSRCLIEEIGVGDCGYSSSRAFGDGEHCPPEDIVARQTLFHGEYLIIQPFL